MSLDDAFLKYQGGIEKNSLIHILDSNTEEEDDTNEPNIIRHSPYYDHDKLVPTLQKNKNCFSILSTNIQAINTKYAELNIFIESLKEVDFHFSVICIQESGLAENVDTSHIQINDYECIPQGKSKRISKGGLIIYLHKNFDYVPKFTLNKYNTWEAQVIQIKKVNTYPSLSL